MKKVLFKSVSAFFSALTLGAMGAVYMAAPHETASASAPEATTLAVSAAPVRSIRPQARHASVFAPRQSPRPPKRPSATHYGAWRSIGDTSWMKDVGLHTCWVAHDPARGMWTFGEDVSQSPLQVTRTDTGKFLRGNVGDFIAYSVRCNLPFVPARLRPKWWI